MPHLALFLFGPPQIQLDGQPVRISRQKATALLAYLVVTGKPHSRNTLATLLWPDQDQKRARSSLRRVLVTLKKAGLDPWLNIQRETIELNTETNLWSDIAEFRRCLSLCLVAQDKADTICLPLLTEAVSLYKADFMSGFSLRDSSDFDEWQLFQTENLRHDFASVLARLVRYHSTLDEFEPAIAYARRWLKIDPLYELAHRQLMQLYAQNNQRSAALRQYQDCQQILQQELGISPSAETQALYQQLQHNKELPTEYPHSLPPTSPPVNPATQLHNFPSQPTSFIGRQHELEEIINRLENPNCRLLTLTGPGGMGKTRLAIQTALEHRQSFLDGLYFVPLASISSTDFLVSTIADHLHFALDGQEDAKPQLLNYIRSKKILLVLDNFEHLIKKAELLSEILTQTLHVKILVTSQQRLNLRGEWVFEVKGMDYPQDNRIDQLESYSAVTLFLQRANHVSSNFKPTVEEKKYIVQICRALEGVPLAIELAAAWARVLSPQEIAAEIEQIYTSQNNLDFLATSLRDVPSRHRTLRSVFEHSWQLLSVDEKRVFSRLSVFHGGGQREAIEWVTETDLRLIVALVDKSLLIRNTEGRYEMHGLLRQYATEKLHDFWQEEQLIYDRHAAYYTTFLQQREKYLKGVAQKEILTEIAREIENIRAAWHWAITQGKFKEIEQALESLGTFYAMYSWFQEGVEAFGRAVEALQPRNNEPNKQLKQLLLGRLLTYLGWFFLRQGLYEQARYLLQQSLDLLQDIDNQQYIAHPLNYLGILAGEIGASAEAKRLLQKSLELYREANNQWGIAWTLSHLAYHTATSAQQNEARALLNESLAIYKAIGHKQGIAVALNNLGHLAYTRQDFTAAQKFLQESLALRREVGFPRGIAVSLDNLGHVYEALGDHLTSQKCYHESLRIAIDIRAIPLALSVLEGIATCLIHQSNTEQALKLLALVVHHPASNKDTLNRARQAIDRLTPHLPREIVDLTSNTTTAQQEEAVRHFDSVVAEILDIQ